TSTQSDGCPSRAHVSYLAPRTLRSRPHKMPIGVDPDRCSAIFYRLFVVGVVDPGIKVVLAQQPHRFAMVARRPGDIELPRTLPDATQLGAEPLVPFPLYSDLLAE